MRRSLQVVGIVLLLVSGLTVGLLAYYKAEQATIVKTSSPSTGQVSDQLHVAKLQISDSATLNSVTVKGSLDTPSVVFTPGHVTSPTKHELYVANDGSLNYFDGSKTTNLSSSNQPITSPQTIINSTTVLGVVLSLQGQGGAIGLGNGLMLSDGKLRSTGVTSLTSASQNLQIATDDNGNLTIADTGSGMGGAVTLAPAAAQSDTSNNASVWINKTGNGNLLQLSTGVAPISRFVVDQTGAIVSGSMSFAQLTGVPTLVNSFDGATGALTLGNGLQRTGQTVSNSGVLSIGNATGALSLGNGLTVSAGQLALSGQVVSSVTGTPNQIIVTGSGGITLSLPQDIAVSSSPRFGSLTLASALPVASGGTGSSTASGARVNLGAAGSGANADITSLSGLTTALGVSQGGTGATNLAQNGVIIGQGAAGLTSVVAGGAGQCLVSTAGGPAFQTCPGGGGVSSLNGLSGALTLTAIDPASLVVSGSTITLQDATSSVKGLASFGTTNLTVVNGIVNTIQDIAVTSSPTFAGLTLSGPLSASSGGTGLGSSPLAGQLLIGNGAGYDLATLTAGSGVTISNTAGNITISSSTAGTCSSCASQSLSNLSSVALNTSLLPGANNTIDLGGSGAAFRNGYIAGVAQVGSLDAASAAALTIGGVNATSVALNKSTVLASGASLTITGGASGTRPSAPVEGMLYYDTTTKSLLVYSNGKWQADRSSRTKTISMGVITGCTGTAPVASANPDATDFIVTSCTSAQSTINAAISTLPAGGGTVYLAEGTYIVDGSITVPSNVTLMGAGSTTLLKLKDGVNTNFNLIINTAANTSGVQIQSLTLDGNKGNNTAGTQRGIATPTVSGSYSGALSNVTIVNFRNEGVYTSNFTSYGLNLTNCTIMNNGGYGVRVKTTGSIVYGNTITGNTSGGIYLDGTTQANLTNNVISNNGGSGIDSLNPLDTVVSSNVIASNASVGVYLWGQNGNSVTGNIIKSNTSSGIELHQSDRANVTGNQVSSNGGNGIRLYGSNDSVISANKIHDNGGTGASSGVVVNYITYRASITDNNITDTAGTGYAIDINPIIGAGMYLSNNLFSGTGAAGIRDTLSDTVYANQSDGSGRLTLKTTAGIGIGTSNNNASLTLQGGLTTIALPAPNGQAVTTSGTSGAVSYSYVVTAYDGLGETLPSSVATTTSGNAVLTATNYNAVSWKSVPGAISYRIYRTATAGTPSSTGLIGTLAAAGAVLNSSGLLTFNDTGLAATGAVPATNTTGGASFTGQLQGSSATFSGTLSVASATTLGQLTTGGVVLFKNSVDSTTAFQVQKSDATPLLIADTANMKVIISKLIVGGDITIGGHIITGGATPVITSGVAACASPTLAISGNDTAGTITVTTGTGCGSAGVLATVTFGTAFGAAPRVMLTPTNAGAASAELYNGASTINSFTLDTALIPGSTTTYSVNYFVSQ